MTQAKPKHRWFQFHLSTVILLMFVAGGMLWINFKSREPMVYSMGQPMSNDPLTMGIGDVPFPCKNFGYPFIFYRNGFEVGSLYIAPKAHPFKQLEYKRMRLISQPEVYWFPLMGDVAVALLVISVIAVGWEWLNKQTRATRHR